MALTDNLTGYWTMDESSGTRNDSTSNGNNLTDNNTVASVTGLLNNAADFTAANSEELTKLDTASLEPGSAFSFQAWVYQKTNTSGARTIFSKWASGGPILHTPNGGDGSELKMFYTGSGSDYAQTSGLGMVHSTWYHVVVVYDGGGSTDADRLKIYVNGTNKTLSFAGGGVPTSFGDTGATFEIGNWNTLSYFWNGYIDEAAFWQRALTSGEVSTLYNSGTPLAYPFSGGGGATVSNLFHGINL